LLKIGRVNPKIICRKKTFILKKETTGCTAFTFVNSGVTKPKFIRFTHNVAR